MTLANIKPVLQDLNTLEAYRPKTTVEVVEKTGDIVSDGVTAMFRRVAEKIREEAQLAVDHAVKAQKEAESLAVDMIALGEKHSQSLLKAADYAKSVLQLMQQQRAVFAEDVTPPA